MELASDNVLALNNLALALKEAQRWDEAENHARAACDRSPDDPSFRSTLAILHLVRGNYGEGWAGHEARRKRGAPAA